MSLFWPIKTGESFFDAWSLVHFAFWFVVGADAASQNWGGWPFWVGVVIGAYIWECFEAFVLEPHGKVRHPEKPWNRWISDPLVGLVAAYVGAKIVGPL